MEVLIQEPSIGMSSLFMLGISEVNVMPNSMNILMLQSLYGVGVTVSEKVIVVICCKDIFSLSTDEGGKISVTQFSNILVFSLSGNSEDRVVSCHLLRVNPSKPTANRVFVSEWEFSLVMDFWVTLTHKIVILLFEVFISVNYLLVPKFSRVSNLS